jgi:tetratricopeptide (TPR) repeat protein
MHSGDPGVFGTEKLIDQIRQEFLDDAEQTSEFETALRRAGANRYQEAFLFLQGRLGQNSANEIVRNAVMGARISGPSSETAAIDIRTAKEDELRLLESDSHWFLNPGTASLGRLVAQYPEKFGRLLLTTNFVPLVEIAIRTAAGQYYKTFLHADGDISQTEGPGCHVVHLHGYWHGADTLHTARQLRQPRPHLKASLASLLRHRLVVICGYGGWDDVFTDALMEVVRDDSASPEILWCFHANSPDVPDRLAVRIAPGVDRGRVSLYEGIDCNLLFPMLFSVWNRLEPRTLVHSVLPTNRVNVNSALRAQLERVVTGDKILRGDEEDRPPLIELFVGRDTELRQLEASDAKVAFITGIGGQGKSTLAAQYFSRCQAGHKFAYFVWRDCKEEREIFENQLAAVVETLSDGRVSRQDLAKQNVQSIVQLFMSLTKGIDVLFVFDNADHYVNLETGRMTTSTDLLIQALLSSESRSRIVFTCRPSVSYGREGCISFHLEGLSLDATLQLFSERGAASPPQEIADAHNLANGHAFWLDLISIQVAKQPTVSLGKLLDRIRSEGGQLPDQTLNSVWNTLKDRERVVLRSLAETVRPETEDQIADYLRSELSYHKVMKALNALRTLNLVVVKRRAAADDVLELHPLVRQFIRQKFSQVERSSFIGEIIKAYNRFMGNHRPQLSERPSFTTLQYWTQAAQLDVAAGRPDAAFATLAEVADEFSTSGYSREFARVVRILLGSIDWVTEHRKYKHFDEVFRIYACSLADLGEWEELEPQLQKFELTVAERDARYILYCDMRCYSKWVREEFTDAIRWGKTGFALKSSSQVDTGYDISHDLALAERDGGQPEVALQVFLHGRKLTEVVDPDELDEARNGPHYGNIGRCLHFMGQVDSALVCYQKSALLIEKNPEEEHLLNQGFIRRWVGELLVAKEQFKLASIFLEAARLKWEQVSPPRAKALALLLHRFKEQLPPPASMSAEDVERIVRDWILGRPLDASLR